MPTHLLFLRDIRGRRGTSGKSLPQIAKRHCVTDVTFPSISSFFFVRTSVRYCQFEVELRKKCVILLVNSNVMPCHRLQSDIKHGIDNPLLLSILDFITVFHFKRGTYGNDS